MIKFSPPTPLFAQADDGAKRVELVDIGVRGANDVDVAQPIWTVMRVSSTDCAITGVLGFDEGLRKHCCLAGLLVITDEPALGTTFSRFRQILWSAGHRDRARLQELSAQS